MVRQLKRANVVELEAVYWKILYWFFAYPNAQIGLNVLAQTLKISKTTANRVVLQLVDTELLKLELLGRAWRVSCNQAHPLFRRRKITYNLGLVYEYGILEEIYKAIPNPRAIILFGSYRRGDDTEKSDIDIAVEVLAGEDLRIVDLGVIPQLGYRQKVPIHLHIFSRNKIDLNLFSNIANGIVLEGFLEVHP